MNEFYVGMGQFFIAVLVFAAFSFIIWLVNSVRHGNINIPDIKVDLHEIKSNIRAQRYDFNGLIREITELKSRIIALESKSQKKK